MFITSVGFLSLPGSYRDPRLAMWELSWADGFLMRSLWSISSILYLLSPSYEYTFGASPNLDFC